MSLWLTKILVSLGSMIGSNRQDAFGRLFTYTRIRSSPEIDPWGKPQIIYLRYMFCYFHRYESTAFY